MDQDTTWYEEGLGPRSHCVKLGNIHCVSKNVPVPPLVCYNFDTHEHILVFFGRNVTDKVSNQKTLYYATPNNMCFCTTWQYGETQKSHFFTEMLHQCIARIQLVAPWFLQSFLSGLVLTLLYDSLNLAIDARGCWGHDSGERKSRAP